jgi:hypothetical protein
MAAARATKRRIQIQGLLLALAMLATVPILVINVSPVFSGSVQPRYEDRWTWILLHASGGTVALFTGALNLAIGTTRSAFAWHRPIGFLYFGSGTLMATTGFYLSFADRLKPASVGIATAMLTVVWVCAAAMAWRAARNRCFDSHREWMIRSFVLTWTFVFCRLAQRGDLFAWLGAEGVTAGVWLYWVGPLFLCEVVLQWGRGRRSA